MEWWIPGMSAVRERLGKSLFERVAGPSGGENRARIHGTPGPRWFGEERPVRVVHGDASMFIGGLSALLLQSLHPLAMSAVAAHSGYQGDPWGRLQRTSLFLATTTYGPADDAQRAVDRVRGVHQRVRGRTATGAEYHAADPHLLAWVHVAEVDSFWRAHRLYGAYPLTPADYDGYVADMARVGTALGVVDPPRDRRELAGPNFGPRRRQRRPPDSCSGIPRSPSPPGFRTPRSPRARSRFCHRGHEGRWGCPMCPRWRRRVCAGPVPGSRP
jgi:hypothetical protein